MALFGIVLEEKNSMFWKKKISLIAEFHKTDLVTVDHFRRDKNLIPNAVKAWFSQLSVVLVDSFWGSSDQILLKPV